MTIEHDRFASGASPTPRRAGHPPGPSRLLSFKSGLSEGTRPFSGARGWPRFAHEHETLLKRLRFLWRRFKRRRR